MKDNKKFWDRFSNVYETVSTAGKNAKRFYRVLEDRTALFLTRDMDVLELAMGPAMLTGAIAKACGRLTATDFSEKMVARARKKQLPANVTIEQADATALQYPDAGFDAVIIANALHIMPDPAKALCEIKRVMKPNALLIAPTYTRECERSKLKHKLMEALGFVTYFPWNDGSYKQFLIEQGFDMIHSEVISWFDYPESFVVCKTKPCA